MGMTPQELGRFMGKTKEAGDCIFWIGGTLDKDGYGTFYFRKKGRRAHRVAYWHYYGDIPEGMVINHTCQNRNCVNHKHLRLATLKENALRESNSLAAINSQKTHCKNGHPFDRKYGKQRYCSICQSEKHKRLRQKWAQQASEIKC